MEDQLKAIVTAHLETVTAEVAENLKSLRSAGRNAANGRFTIKVVLTSMWEGEKPATATGIDLRATMDRAVTEFAELNRRSDKQFEASVSAVFKDRELHIPKELWQQLLV